MFTQVNNYFTGEILNKFSIEMVWNSWKTFTFVASTLLVSGRDCNRGNLLLINCILWQKSISRIKSIRWEIKWLQRYIFKYMKFSFVGFFLAFFVLGFYMFVCWLVLLWVFCLFLSFLVGCLLGLFPSQKFLSNRKSNSDANEDFYTGNRKYSGVRVPVSIMSFLGDQYEINLVSSHSQCIAGSPEILFSIKENCLISWQYHWVP